MLHGADDELVPEGSVRKLVEKLNTQKGINIDYRVMPAAGHIFTPPQADQVADAAEDHINVTLNRKRISLAAD
jgi:dipeptidyl aminopeptidase/acylaminoacyl peptidase